MSPIRSLTQLKRLVRVGSRIECLSHWRDDVRTDLPPHAGTVREVVKVQTNGYYATIEGQTKPDSDELMRWWAPWPQAKDVVLGEDGTWTLRWPPKGEAVFRFAADDRTLADAGLTSAAAR